ncbi:spermatid maturation protein 1 [Eptesicus fuscus]|uniref:spermatid maturation protein 1 n=1 Tax=Eptesicus fuscus TaxID=29078 RepID=UPI0024040DEA|nr:spermatid maturation protein 1 [Eptesicus fuscus]
MAVAEQPWPRCASYHSPNTNSCQDLGNSILLLLGLIICMNIGINMVTLLWRRLRFFLHQMFCSIVSEKEASKSSSPRKKTQHPKQSSPAVHLRCTMDPVKMTVTPRPARRQRHRGWSARHAHHPTAWAPDTDDEEKPPHQHTAICSHNWDHPSDWDGFQSTQGFWDPWAQDTAGLPTQGIRFQQAVEGRPLKREMRSEMSLEAYVYPVNPPPPSPQCHKNNGGRAGAEGGQEQHSPDPPAPPPIRGPAVVPDIPRRHPSRHLVYDALDVRRRLRELTQEVESMAHCYPMAATARSNTAEGVNKDWVYRPLTER